MYRLILAMDANFRLKNRLRTSSRTDPGLGTGWAYFVPEEEYREHILQYVTQEEVRLILRINILRSNAEAFTDIYRSVHVLVSKLWQMRTRRTQKAYALPGLEGLSVLATRSGDQTGWATFKKEKGEYSTVYLLVSLTLTFVIGTATWILFIVRALGSSAGSYESSFHMTLSVSGRPTFSTRGSPVFL